MKIGYAAACAALMLAMSGAPAIGQTSPAPAQNGLHPDQHGPASFAAPPPAAQPEPATAPTITVVARHPRKRRWKTTAGHVGRCKRHFRSYNPRTNLYVPRPGLRRRCVL